LGNTAAARRILVGSEIRRPWWLSHQKYFTYVKYKNTQRVRKTPRLHVDAVHEAESVGALSALPARQRAIRATEDIWNL
jgi:hypothetical protein